MNDANNLVTFFNKITSEDTINTSHISIYISLYLSWKNSNYKNPFQITRHTVMLCSKVNSKATYHKCMKELHDLGYIIYEPSFHPHEGSKVFLVDLNKRNQNES